MYGKSVVMVAILLSLSFADAHTSGRKLLYGGKSVAPGGANGIGQGNNYLIEGQRNDLAAFATEDAIQKAVAKGKAFLASAVGAKAALSASDRSVATKTFDKMNAQGNRKLQQAIDRSTQSTNSRQLLSGDRADRTAMAAQVVSEQVLKATNADTMGAIKAATAKGLSFAKLTTSISARPADFTP